MFLVVVAVGELTVPEAGPHLNDVAPQRPLPSGPCTQSQDRDPAAALSIEASWPLPGPALGDSFHHEPTISSAATTTSYPHSNSQAEQSIPIPLDIQPKINFPSQIQSETHNGAQTTIRRRAVHLSRSSVLLRFIHSSSSHVHHNNSPDTTTCNKTQGQRRGPELGQDHQQCGLALRRHDPPADQAAGRLHGVPGGGRGAAVCVLRAGGELRTSHMGLG